MSEEDFLKSDTLSKQETEKLFHMLEIKLEHERRAWQRARSQIRVIRALGFLFLFVLIAGSLFAFYMLRMRAEEARLHKAQQTTFSIP